MNNANFYFNKPSNEAVISYKSGSEERIKLEKQLEELNNNVMEIPLVINGKEVYTNDIGELRNPGNNKLLARYHKARKEDVNAAIKSSLEARKAWATVSWIERVSISLKIAELIAKDYRYLINAATMLGQGKNSFQAEIDAACETIDFFRFNAFYVSQIYNDQPLSASDTLNRVEYRPLEGFVFAVSPFNFTAIASNLVMAPVVLGNVVVWKPASTSLLSNYILMQIYKKAGVPDGVINFLPGQGSLIGNEVMQNPDLAGLHFTGSNATFNQLWKNVAENLENYKSYPRVVGETGGKDFIFVHHSADSDIVVNAMVKGAFEYQGQKCSAASRAYIPKSLWPSIKEGMGEILSQIRMGEVTDFDNFINPVIDKAAFERINGYIKFAAEAEDAEILFGGQSDDSKGYYISPTVILTNNPYFKTMKEEIFGPVLTVYVYDDGDYEKTLDICDNTSPYGLTGSIFSNDRYAMLKACQVLRYAAGNFYINDKPSGAVVGQQPFGGARASGTNDKAGSYLNLLKWISPRTIKENFMPPSVFSYPLK